MAYNDFVIAMSIIAEIKYSMKSKGMSSKAVAGAAKSQSMLQTSPSQGMSRTTALGLSNSPIKKAPPPTSGKITDDNISKRGKTLHMSQLNNNGALSSPSTSSTMEVASDGNADVVVVCLGMMRESFVGITNDFEKVLLLYHS